MKRYERYADEIAALIGNGTLRPGDRLPSVRQASRSRKISPATVFEAYYLLEGRGLIHPRARSGYFVSSQADSNHAPQPSLPRQRSAKVEISDLVFEVLGAAKDRNVVPLGSAFPSPELFPLGQLAKHLARGMRTLDPWRIVEDLPPGNHRLRRQIGVRYGIAGMTIDSEEIIVTSGALEALNLCLSAVTRPGDVVVVESPTFYAALQALERLSLKVVEVATSPRTGIDLDSLATVLQRHSVKACWLMPNFQNPLGSCMTVERKQALVHYDAAAKVRIGSIEPVIDHMDATTEKLNTDRIEAAEALLNAARADVAADRYIMFASFVIALIIAVAFAWLLARHITRGLAQAEEVAQTVTRGELGRRIVIDRHDEIGRVLQALQDMDTKLTSTVIQVRDSATAVDQAARQLSQGSDDLSERTQEQAAALEETAASIEEMTATVKQTGDNARQANQLATGTRNEADEGGAVVRRAVAAMREITSSSKRIEDIIGVIDEIAFQTNLLALNAAVEAARAGEQGRGFAVVASEVRQLAQRSASAAKEIKTLIGDSVNKVNNGAALVDASGKTLDDIVNGVKKVSDIVAEMAAATAEQSQGIDQINNAISSMDGATQQNAALVEESAAAAKLMQQQAYELQRLVAFFSIAGRAGAPVLANDSSQNKVIRYRPAIKSRVPVQSASPPPQAKAGGGGSSEWLEF